MKQNAKLKEDFDNRIEELKEEISDKQESFSDLSRRLESSEAMVKALETQKYELEGMLKHSKERFSYVEERLQTYVTDRDEKEVMARNEEESDKFIRILQE